MRPHFALAIIVSATIHAALVLSTAMVTKYRAPPPDTIGGGGMGGDVIVTFVADGSGGGSLLEVGSTRPGGGPKKGEGARSMRQKMVAPAQKKDAGKQLAIVDKDAVEGSVDMDGGGDEDASSSGVPGPLSAGSGGGAGGGHGGGIGPGRGKGNPVLSQIWVKINRSKYYPWIARKNGWEGSPRVRFVIGKFGEIRDVRLAESCGIHELDQAALETIRRSAPLPYYPKAITIAIRYSLSDPQGP